MNRAPLPTALLLAGLATSLSGLPSCAERPRPPRHLIFLSLDTTRADHLGAHGGTAARTPRLDALAAEGVVLDDMNTVATTTLPAHVSMFTGTWPQRHGVVRNGYTVHRSNELLPERLTEAGFHTAGFSSAVALSELLGFDQGFAVWDQDEDTFEGPVVANREARRADAITDATLAHLDSAAARDAERLFLFVHYTDPHAPYDPPEPFRSAAKAPVDADGSWVAVKRAQHAHQRAAGHTAPVVGQLSPALALDPPGRPLPGDEGRARLYAGEVEFLDHHVGRLLDGLDARGILDDALVVVTSDHGETFWEHGDVWSHGLAVYDTTVRVPMILRYPGAAHAGTRLDVCASLVDLLPTMLAALGLPEAKGIDGVDLGPAIAGTGGAAFDRGPVYAIAPGTGPGLEEGTGPWKGERKSHAIRDGRFKAIWTPYLGTLELYDLAADPGERNDLMRSSPEPATLERGARLKDRLAAWIATARPRPSVFYPRVKTGDPARDAQARRYLEQLQQMGYAGGDGD